jgi:PilZ domain-containing protein
MISMMISQSELEVLLEQLARGQSVNLGIGDPPGRGWFRGSVVSHDTAAGRLILTCFMDRPTDRPLEPGERVVVAATRIDDGEHSAPMDVEYCGTGPQPEVRLRMAGAWQREDERRHQVRVPLDLPTSRARRWATGAWRDLPANVIDLSSRGVGLRVGQAVQIGDRLSLLIPLNDGQPELRVTVEVRHVRASGDHWLAGGLFRTLAPGDHERVIRFVFGELRQREGL